MKKYISEILIPCLLLQLFGCYSYREITLNELKDYPGEKDVRIQVDTNFIIFNRKADWYNKMDWITTDSSIVITNKIWKAFADTTNPTIEQKEINYSHIVKTEIEEIDYLKTTIFSATIVSVMLIIIIVIGATQGEMMNVNGMYN
ncbi:MAG: hypothetical protein WHT45_06620 [Ignavibacterium sp.]